MARPLATDAVPAPGPATESPCWPVYEQNHGLENSSDVVSWSRGTDDGRGKDNLAQWRARLATRRESSRRPEGRAFRESTVGCESLCLETTGEASSRSEGERADAG